MNIEEVHGSKFGSNVAQTATNINSEGGEGSTSQHVLWIYTVGIRVLKSKPLDDGEMFHIIGVVSSTR